LTDRNELVESLKEVHDPEIGMNIVDLGLVYGLDWDEEKGQVHVDLTLTSPGCPLGPQIIRDIRRALGELDGVLQVEVDLVWSPLWHPSMMSDYAKDELGYDEELGMGLGTY
jgi:metal-sulfur cluster biosynthetic enzyme